MENSSVNLTIRIGKSTKELSIQVSTNDYDALSNAIFELYSQAEEYLVDEEIKEFSKSVNVN